MEKKITKKTKLLIAAAIVVVIAGGISAAVLLHNPLKLQKDTVNVVSRSVQMRKTIWQRM